MEIGFKPKTKDDWRLLLLLIKCIRLATKEDIVCMTEAFLVNKINEEKGLMQFYECLACMDTSPTKDWKKGSLPCHIRYRSCGKRHPSLTCPICGHMHDLTWDEQPKQVTQGEEKG